MTIKPLTPQQVADLSPGVRDLVVALRAAGFHTMDSGDGSNYADGMGCAVPFKMVFVASIPADLVETANSLAVWLSDHGLDWPAYTVQASYNPFDGVAGVLVSELNDEAMEYREGITGVRPVGMC